MEEVIMEKELEYYSSSGEKVKSSVKVYPSRLVIEKKNELESVLIPYINVLKFYRDPKWGYLIAGITLSAFAAIFFILPPKMFILETPAKELIGFIILIVAISCIVAWWMYRSFVLLINSFGHYSRLISRQETPLRELFETLEKLRTQNFKIEED
jgi:magnesium-transporting ATPase (P-type)